MKTTVYQTPHVRVSQNPLTGDWLCQGEGPIQSHAYFCKDLSAASQMAQTMGHFAKTQERKAFPVNIGYLGTGREESVVRGVSHATGQPEAAQRGVHQAAAQERPVVQ